jgi:hypothetical protein
MQFVIQSGTEIRRIEERRGDADSTLDLVLCLIARRRPNILVIDPEGRRLNIPDLWRLAAQSTGRRKTEIQALFH